MSKQAKLSKSESMKYNKESINFANLIKYWIKLKTIDSNHLNFGVICEKRYQLQKLLFEKGLLTLDTEFLILEQKFFYLISCLDTKNREFSKEVGSGFSRIDKAFINDKSSDEDFWMHNIHTNIQHHQTYELIKLNITDLITQWTRVYNELWIYNDQFHYQVWFKHKFEQFKHKIRTYQCAIVYKLVVNLFNSMYGLIKSRNFERKDEYLELVQTILIQLTIEIEIYFKLKAKRIKTTGYESFSTQIIKRIAYLNSKRCNFNYLNSTNSSICKRNSIDLIGRLKDSAVDKRKWFADLNDLGLIDVNRKLFEKFTDHSFRSWFQPDEQSSFNSSVDQSIDKSIDKIYDRTYDKSFDKANEKPNDKNGLNRSTGKTVIIPSKFNELINRQQILNLSYHSLQLISGEPSSKLVDQLEKVYWRQFWFSLNFHIQHSGLKATFQSMIDEDVDSTGKTNQFHKLLENIKSDFLIEKMYQQFYEFKSVNVKRREEMITRCVSYVMSVYRLCSNHLIKVNTEIQKTNSFLFILQIEDTFNTVAKMVERVTFFTDLEELIFVLINIDTINDKVKFIESSISSERNFNYSNFFGKIQIHLVNRLEMLLEYTIANSINKHYSITSSPVLKPTDWMQRLIEDVFQSILKFKSTKARTPIKDRIEAIYIRKFNLFLLKIYDLTLRKEKKSIDNLKESLHFYMNWVSVQYCQHIKIDNFPNYFLELIEQNPNLHFETASGNQFIVNRKSLINRNQIAPQSIYEATNVDSSTYTDCRDSFRRVYFRTDADQRLKIANKKSYLNCLFCFDTV